MTATISLDAFQEEALDFFDAAKGRVIYADPMGARKTGTVLSWLSANIDIADGHYSMSFPKVLVVAPGAVHGHWAREAHKFAHEYQVKIGRGSPTQRQNLLESIPDGRACIYITSYALMVKDEGWIKDAGFDTIIFDEAHKLKGRRTEVALSANSVVRNVPRLILATGTPILNRASELWQYLHMLMPSTYTSFWKWAEEHFIVTPKTYRGRRDVVREVGGFQPGHEDIVRAQLTGVLLQRELHELFNETEHPWIVEPEHIEIEVEMSPKERKAYDKMAQDAWVSLDNVLIQAGNGMVVSTRLEQLASDWGVLDATMETSSKTKATVELAETLVTRQPVIIFAKYKETVHRIATELRKKHLTVFEWTGDVKPAGKEWCLQQYAEGKMDVVVGTIASMGEGVDGFQYRSSQMILHDRAWVPGINDQVIGREKRSGQKDRVQVWHVYLKDTIDTTIVQACLDKQNVIDSLAGRSVKDVIYGRVLAFELDEEE